jgi:hypothetical protein
MQDESNPLERHLIEMFTLAGEYCLAIENLAQDNKEELFKFLSRISPILYLKGLLFPVSEEPVDEGNERVVTEEQWETVFNNLRNIFGADDFFFFVDQKSPDSNEAVKGSLAELFADVYQDLKDFAWLMTKNSTLARNHAAYEIKRLFISNWGLKLLLAQSILHSRVIDKAPDDDYPDLD